MDLQLLVKTSPRYRKEKEYVLHVVLDVFLGLDYQIDWSGDDKCFVFESAGNRFQLASVLFLLPEDEWLTKISIPHWPIPVLENTDPAAFRSTIPVLFSTTPQQSLIRISEADLLGSIFFMLTRYEEVADFSPDPLGRYDFRKSILMNGDLLRRPLVNEYLEVLKKAILEILPGVKFRSRAYQLLLSHDVDVPLTLHLGTKSNLRKLGGDLIERRSIGLFIRRALSILHYLFTGSHRYDPNFNFRWIVETLKEHNVTSTFNFIPISGPHEVDSHYEIDKEPIPSLLKYLHSNGFEIGFHPGLPAFNDEKRTSQELARLNSVLHQLELPAVVRGRHHYLRWINPESWKIWNNLHLTADGSVGFSGINGFRCGTCFEFPVFDLKDRSMLRLIEEPLVVMDVNTQTGSNLNALNRDVLYFSEVCRYFGGSFSLLYHNNLLISNHQKANFKRLLTQIAKM
ncbi:MAG: hypothetical protein K1X47_02120 [Cyclobacteriaceae bacterium]|nr:hypothetical protein [Cyclobacteriaceae bacterium]